MKVITGNLLDLAEDGYFDVIVHGCNCFCTMNSGIAKEIKERWPWVYEADLGTISGDSSKLGRYTATPVIVSDFKDTTHSFIVVNAYTQYRYGRDKQYADYDAISRVFSEIANNFYGTGKRIGYPKIGAGLAGGDWNVISAIIDEQLAGMDHTLVVLT